MGRWADRRVTTKVDTFRTRGGIGWTPGVLECVNGRMVCFVGPMECREGPRVCREGPTESAEGTRIHRYGARERRVSPRMCITGAMDLRDGPVECGAGPRMVAFAARVVWFGGREGREGSRECGEGLWESRVGRMGVVRGRGWSRRTDGRLALHQLPQISRNRPGSSTSRASGAPSGCQTSRSSRNSGRASLGRQRSIARASRSTIQYSGMPIF